MIIGYTITIPSIGISVI